jgi:hypothetical protein
VREGSPSTILADRAGARGLGTKWCLMVSVAHDPRLRHSRDGSYKAARHPYPPIPLSERRHIVAAGIPASTGTASRTPDIVQRSHTDSRGKRPVVAPGAVGVTYRASALT